MAKKPEPSDVCADRIVRIIPTGHVRIIPKDDRLIRPCELNEWGVEAGFPEGTDLRKLVEGVRTCPRRKELGLPIIQSAPGNRGEKLTPESELLLLKSGFFHQPGQLAGLD